MARARTQQTCGGLRHGLRHALDNLSREVRDLGRKVDVSIGTLTGVLECEDTAKVRRLASGRDDERLRLRGARLDEECMLLQACHSPVACDLRLLHALREITDHVARAGVLCEQAFRALDETSGQPAGDLDATIARMALYTHALFGQGLRAFEYRDIGRARDLEAFDDEVDLLYFEVMALSVSSQPDGASSSGGLVRAALLAHYLERIADHGVGIGRRTVFAVTGEQG